MCGSLVHLRGNIERSIAQVLNMQTQVDTGGFKRSMTEQVSDRLERRALT